MNPQKIDEERFQHSIFHIEKSLILVQNKYYLMSKCHLVIQ